MTPITTDIADLISRLGRMADAMEAGDPRAASWGAAIRKAARRIEELERRDELLRERLFILSDRLRASGAIEDDAVHAAYEQVVATLQPKEQP